MPESMSLLWLMKWLMVKSCIICKVLLYRACTHLFRLSRFCRNRCRYKAYTQPQGTIYTKHHFFLGINMENLNFWYCRGTWWEMELPMMCMMAMLSSRLLTEWALFRMNFSRYVYMCVCVDVATISHRILTVHALLCRQLIPNATESITTPRARTVRTNLSKLMK